MLVVKSNKPKWAYPSMIDQFLNRELASVFGSDFQSLVPNVNIVETENAYSIEVAAPGLKKEDFSISLDKETLTISADVKKENEEKKPNYLKKEFSYQSFKRSFTMPENVNKEGIGASYENGVLQVGLPKKEKATETSSKTIAIS